MAIQAARITGIVAGETVLTEEQVLTGYETSITTNTSANTYALYTGTTVDAWSGSLSFGAYAHEVIILCKNNPLNILFSVDNIVWTYAMEIPADTMIFLSIRAGYFQVQSKNTGKHAVYQVQGFRKV